MIGAILVVDHTILTREVIEMDIQKNVNSYLDDVIRAINDRVERFIMLALASHVDRREIEILKASDPATMISCVTVRTPRWDGIVRYHILYDGFETNVQSYIKPRIGEDK